MIILWNDYEAMVRAGLPPAYARTYTELCKRDDYAAQDFAEQYRYAVSDLDRVEIVANWQRMIDESESE